VKRLLLISLIVVLLPAGAASASSKQAMTFEAPAELLLDGAREQTLDEIQGLGVSQIRALVIWNDFTSRAPSKTPPKFDTADPDAYPAGTWDALDHLIASTQRRGMTVQLTLTGPVPRWATKRRKGHVKDPSAKWFGRWARAVAARYGDSVNLWSIWNEPNHPDFLGPQYKSGDPHTPRLYRGLYAAGESAIHGAAGGEKDKVLFGETAPIGNQNVVSPLGFLRGALCLNKSYQRSGGCKRLRIDGFAHHAYARKGNPTSVSQDQDEVSIGTLSRLTRAIDKAAKVRAFTGGRGVYLTEFGVQSKPDTVAGVSYQRQAEYLAISERIAYANPRVKAFSQYLMLDDKPRKGVPRIRRYPGFETGLRSAKGKKKPAYNGFMLPLAVKRYGSQDVAWGRVRPATGPTEVTIEHKVGNGGWRRLTALQTTGVYAFRTAHRSRHSYRVKWTRADGVTITGPPIRAY
jgi:Cellulase (glycosyl hydrolase family 5)